MNNTQLPLSVTKTPGFKLLSKVTMHALTRGIGSIELAFQVLFAPGSDRLSDIDSRRIKVLAEFLQNNPNLEVNLAGHTDPRGTDEYNNVLSIERAKGVYFEMARLGVQPGRISYSGHGSDFSIATKQDQDAYQLERRVDIEISAKTNQTEG